MFGFKKNKKKEAEQSSSPDPAAEKALREKDSEAPADSQPPQKKKRFPLKKLIIMLVAALIMAASGLGIFHFFFQSKDAPPTYPGTELPHVSLPEEMLEFCFYQIPDIYSHLVEYNENIQILEQEIQRIISIEQKYPAQAKITDKEKKIWEKTRSSLEKSFSGIQKTIREFYVLFQVNSQAGSQLVEERKEELSRQAAEFLTPAREQILQLDTGTKKAIPQGFFAKQVYKIKKKFL